jgi:GDP-L-fucose synthase
MNLRNKKILVLGSNGFLGKRLCKLLDLKKIKHTKATRKNCNLINYNEIQRYLNLKKPDIVINCAAFVGGINFSRLYPYEVLFKNMSLSTNIINACTNSNVKKIVNISSACVYSDVLKGPFKEKQIWDKPMHASVKFYGLSKQYSFMAAEALAEQTKTKMINLIPANLFGPGDKFDQNLSHVASAMIAKLYNAKIKNKKSVEFYGSGETVREFLHVDDFAEAILLATKLYKDIEPLNIGNGTGLKIKNLFKIINSYIKYNGKIIWNRKYPDGAKYKVMDNKKMIEKLKWKPTIPFKIGISETIKEYSKNYEG